MIKKIAFLGILLFSGIYLFAQKFSVSGYIREEGSKELLIGVNVFVPDLNTGTISNEYGFYSLTLPAGKYQIVFSYVGYQSVQLELNFERNQSLDQYLKPGKAI